MALEPGNEGRLTGARSPARETMQYLNEGDPPDRGRVKTLGILQLAHAPLSHRGTLGDVKTFGYPVTFLQVREAWLEAVIRGDDAAGQAFVAGARRLVECGVAAVMTNCGLTSIFQKRLAGAVKVPVATSPLLQLPLIEALLAENKSIGVLTYDSTRLAEKFLTAAGYEGRRSRIVIAGIEGTSAWTELAKPEPEVDANALETDLLAVTGRLLEQDPGIGALLLECGAFCPHAGRLRVVTGLPVFDFVTLADHLMASVATSSVRPPLVPNSDQSTGIGA